MPDNQTIVSIGLMREAFSSEFTRALFGGADTHEPGLRLIGQLVRHTEDDGLIGAIIAAALPENHSGDTLEELTELIAGARRKGFGGQVQNSGRRPSTIELLERLFVQRGAELFHDERHASYVGIPTPAGGIINAPVGSARSNHFLQEIFYPATNRALRTRDRDEFTEDLRALAVFKGQRLPIYIRVGGDAHTIYHDLARDDGAVVEVTTDGYRLTHNPAAKLIRMQGMKALPPPKARESHMSRGLLR